MDLILNTLPYSIVRRRVYSRVRLSSLTNIYNHTTTQPHNLTTLQPHNLTILVAFKFLADSGAKIVEVSTAFQDVASEVTSRSIRTLDHADAPFEGSYEESSEIYVDNKAMDDEAIDIKEI